MKPGVEHERLSAYLDDALPAAEREEFERVLASRPDLLALADEWRQLRTAFRALPARTLPPAFNERVLATAEQRMLRGPATRVERAAPRRHWYAWGGVAVAAAAVLLVILSIPRGELRLARQQAPLDKSPAASTIGKEADRADRRISPPPQELIADDLSAGPPAAPAEDVDPQEIPLGHIAATARPTYDFTVVVFPENTTQLNQLRRMLPRPAMEVSAAKLERSAFQPDVEGMKRNRVGVPARRRDVTDGPSMYAAAPSVDLYAAAGAAVAIQSLLQDLQEAGIPMEQRGPIDPSGLPSTAAPWAATARSDRSDSVVKAMADGAGYATTEELAEADGLPAAVENRQGIRFQYLGQAAMAPSQQGRKAQNDADREQMPGSDAAASRESQQILIVVQNPSSIAEPEDH